MSILRKFFSGGRSRGEAPGHWAEPLQPEDEFFVIGDVHGRVDALTAALAAVRAAAEAAPVVLVGDYIDRGEDSADVLRQLFGLTGDRAAPVACLMGNHERMCLQFIDDPERYGDRWMRFGGLQTLASFGVGLEGGKAREATRDALIAAMGEELVTWLRRLPTFWISGNVAVTHAGADPLQPIPSQPSRNLVWGHPEFTTQSRPDGMWVVHGHTIVEKPVVAGGRISIDTGAYATGRLTAARIAADGVSFATT